MTKFEDKPSYWNGTGKYQKEYKRLHKKLVPLSGVADTLEGELLRTLGRVYNEVFNNGGCNFDLLHMKAHALFFLRFDDLWSLNTGKVVKSILKGKTTHLDELTDAVVLLVMDRVK